MGTQRSTATVYDRVASMYDAMQAPMEWLGGYRRRARVLGSATGRVLELGVGTAANLEHYPAGLELCGIDLSRRMLERASLRLARGPQRMQLVQGDAERLPFPDAAFDTIAATCVFCSVADPVRGLREAARVVRPEGRLLLLEHVRPENPLLGRLFDLLTPLTKWLMGPEINRRTEENVRAAGLRIMSVRRQGVWREIEARR